MAQERNNTGENLVAYKSISLISAEVAQRLGLESEVPIFISPRTISKEICAECGQHYGPLLYQTNYVTQAQHFHDRNGGVYHRVHKQPLFPIYGNWFALIQP